MFGFSKRSRRKKLLQEPLADECRLILEKNVAVFPLLSAAERERLIAATKIIVAERSFVGCGGLAITDEMKLTIAAEAALLLLGEDDYYFDRVPTIFIHPHYQTTKAHHDLATAVLVEEDVLIDGQALAQGEIHLVW